MTPCIWLRYRTRDALYGRRGPAGEAQERLNLRLLVDVFELRLLELLLQRLNALFQRDDLSLHAGALASQHLAR